MRFSQIGKLTQKPVVLENIDVTVEPFSPGNNYHAHSLTRSCFGIHVLLKLKPIQSTLSFIHFLNNDGFGFISILTY